MEETAAVRLIKEYGTVRYGIEEFNDLDLVRLQYFPVPFSVTEMVAVKKDGSRTCFYTAQDKSFEGLGL